MTDIKKNGSMIEDIGNWNIRLNVHRRNALIERIKWGRHDRWYHHWYKTLLFRLIELIVHVDEFII
jgi:hypothetical protein